MAAPVVAGGLWDRVKESTARTVEQGGVMIGAGASKAQALTEAGLEKGSELTEKGIEVGGKALEGGIDYGKQLAEDTASHFCRDGSPEEIRAAVDQMAFDTFVDLGLDASAEASGMLGKERADLATRFQDGMALYRVTEGGLKVTATLTGTRFWPDAALNQPPPGP